MVKWDEEHKLKLLLAIIEHLNPTSLPWDKLASAMGPEFTSEAVRGQYKTIKKGFNLTPIGANTTSTPSSSSKTKPKPKPKQPTTSAKAKTTTPPTTKNRKRKAAEASLSDDDDANDENKQTALKSSSSDLVENENGIKGGGGVIVKTEQADEGIDLEDDDLYDAA